MSKWFCVFKMSEKHGMNYPPPSYQAPWNLMNKSWFLLLLPQQPLIAELLRFSFLCKSAGELEKFLMSYYSSYNMVENWSLRILHASFCLWRWNPDFVSWSLSWLFPAASPLSTAVLLFKVFSLVPLCSLPAHEFPVVFWTWITG